MVATIILGRILGVDGFGQFGMIQNTIGVFGQIAGSGLKTTTVKFTAEYRSIDNTKTSSYISLGLISGSAFGIIGSLLLYLISDWLAFEVFLMEGLSLTIKISSVLVFTGVINSVQTGVLVGLEEFRKSAFISVIRGVFYALLVGISCYIWGLNGAMGGLLISEVLTLFTGQLFLRNALKSHGIKLNFQCIRKFELKSFWNFAVPSSIGSIVTMPAVWLSNFILINNTDGFSNLGIYNAADKWRQLILFFPSAIFPIILPMLTSSLGREKLNLYKKVFGVNLAVCVLSVVIPSLGVVIFSDQLMAVYGNDFVSGKVILLILCGNALLSVLNNVVGQGIVSFGLIWVRTWLDSILALLTVVFSLFLIPRYQGLGLAAANLFAFGITTIFLLGYFLFQLKQRGYLGK